MKKLMTELINSIKYHLQNDNLPICYSKFIISISEFITNNNEDLLPLLINVQNVDSELLDNICIGTQNIIYNFNCSDLSWEHLLIIKSSTRAVLSCILENITRFLNSSLNAVVVTYLIQSSSIDYTLAFTRRKLMRLCYDINETPKGQICGLSKYYFYPCEFCHGVGDCLHGSISKLLLLCLL